MFRRRWSGLPKDPSFPSTLDDLGYFVNEADEIRSISAPDYYFKFFLDRNARVNECHRFRFNRALQEEVIHPRLEKHGLKKVLLPLGTTDPSERHVPIFVSDDIECKSRVVVIFGEPSQDLGNLALRVANGRGGIDKGSMVSVVKHLKQQVSSADDDSPPGIVLANLGELYWWPEGKLALTLQAFSATPRPSMVHEGCKIGYGNFVPMNESHADHIAHILEDVVPGLAAGDARLDLVGIGLGADELEKYLDRDGVWEQLGPRINTLSILGGVISGENLDCQEFKEFLSNRARAYIVCDEPIGTPLADHNGNPKTGTFTEHATAAVLSSGEPVHTECILIKALETILGWPEEVAKIGADQYEHPEVQVEFADPERTEPTWNDTASGEEAGTGRDDDAAGQATTVNESSIKPIFSVSVAVDNGTAPAVGKQVGAAPAATKPGSKRDKGGRVEALGDGAGDIIDPKTGNRHLAISKEGPDEPEKVAEGWNWDDGMSPEMDQRIKEGLERFRRTGSLMDPREVERLEAEMEDIKDGIQGSY